MKFRLLRFLNRPRNRFVRIFFSLMGFSGTLLVTQDRRLALWIMQTLKNGDFMHGFRLCSWFARLGWPRWTFLKDEFFLFPEKGSLEDLDRLNLFLDRRSNSLPIEEFLGNKMMIQGKRLQLLIREGMTQKNDLKDPLETFFVYSRRLRQWAREQKTLLPKNKSTVRKGDFSKKDAKEALIDFCKILPPEQWHWYLVSGTFLGLIREGGFLAHDCDIDLGIHSENFHKEDILNAIKNSSFTIANIETCEDFEDRGEYFCLQSTLCLIKLVHPKGVHIDLFVHHREGNKRWHGSTVQRWVNQDFNIKEYLFEGCKVFAPDNPDQYLTEAYGDWKTPVTNYNCTTGAPNLKISANFLCIALFHKLLAHFARTNQTDYKRIETLISEVSILASK